MLACPVLDVRGRSRPRHILEYLDKNHADGCMTCRQKGRN